MGKSQSISDLGYLEQQVHALRRDVDRMSALVDNWIAETDDRWRQTKNLLESRFGREEADRVVGELKPAKRRRPDLRFKAGSPREGTLKL
jgi:hypothetical protein